MRDPRWLSRLLVNLIHSELLAEHGGSPGVREGGEDLIESALARPRNRFAYEASPDLADLAAAYLFGIVKNHGFVDGNKRTGFASAVTFLHLNGMRLTASETEAYDAVMAAAGGSLSEAELARWMRGHTEPVAK